MNYSGDKNMQDIVELLEKSGRFSEEEISGAERYLSGVEAQEALEKFPYRELSGMPEGAQICRRFEELLRKKEHDLAGRLGRLLFAAGQTSGYEMYPEDFFFCQEKELWMEPSGKAALLAMAIGKERCSLKGNSFQRLFQTADCQTENLRKAMEYELKYAPRGRLVLLAAYFAFQRPEVCAEAWPPCLDERDVRLLEQYEGLLAGMIPYVYQDELGKETVKHIIDALKQEEVDGEILKMVRVRIRMTDISFRLMAACAFLNYALSALLRNVLSICLAADAEAALGAVKDVDLRGELREKGGDFDTLFGVDSRKLIQWAAEHNYTEILKAQFGKNPEAYVECMGEVNFYIYCKMVPVVEAMDKNVYWKWQKKAVYTKRKEIADDFAKSIERFLRKADRGLTTKVREYLRHGNGPEAVYACKKALADKAYCWPSSGLRYMLQGYQRNFGYDVFSSRCETLLAVAQGFSAYHFFSYPWYGIDRIEEKPGAVFRRLFASMESEGVDVEHQLGAYVGLYESTTYESWMKEMREAGKEIFGVYFVQKRDEMLEIFRKAGSAGRILALEVMAQDAQKNREEILKSAEDASKQVKEVLLRILYGEKGWVEEVEGLLSAKKAPVREIGVRVLAKWLEETALSAGEDDAGGTAPENNSAEDGSSGMGEELHEKCMRILKQALEKEKSAKIKDLIEKVLQTGGGEGGSTLSEEELVKEIHKGNRKRVLAWAYAEPFSKVHRKDGREAEEEYLQAILLYYYVMCPFGVSRSASFLAASLKETEFEVYVNELYDRWLEEGAEAKKRWVLYAAAVHGGTGMVKKLYRQIQEWPKESRGAMAVEAVQALVLSPDPQGLLTVDGMSRKFKYRQVKTAAGKALESAAVRLGITQEELADRIVPDLGFDEKMERVFDYGSRKFLVRITTVLEAEVFDEKGGKLKNMPVPGKRDEEEKAAKAYEEFKLLKKQLKTVVSSQKMRLESALSTGRQWSVQAWKNLFVKNPVMHQFAIGLIWGVYEDGKLTTAFRYMEDGSFNTEEEAEFALPEEEQVIGRGQCIGLVHPIELSQDSINTWKEQLADYEIVQPIVQIDRPVYERTEEEAEQKSLDRFAGMIVNDLALGGKLTAFGWYRGQAEDAGVFYTYYREDRELSLKTELHFSGSYIGEGNQNVTIYEVNFYKTNSDSAAAGGISGADGASNTKEQICALKELPDRYFSEMVLQISQAAAFNQGRDEDWKKKRM